MMKIYHYLKNSYKTTMNIKKLVKWLIFQIVLLISHANIVLIIIKLLAIMLKTNNLPFANLQYRIFQSAIKGLRYFFISLDG